MSNLEVSIQTAVEPSCPTTARGFKAVSEADCSQKALRGQSGGGVLTLAIIGQCFAHRRSRVRVWSYRPGISAVQCLPVWLRNVQYCSSEGDETDDGLVDFWPRIYYIPQQLELGE